MDETYSNVVGQDSLTRFDEQRRRRKKRSGRNRSGNKNKSGGGRGEGVWKRITARRKPDGNKQGKP